MGLVNSQKLILSPLVRSRLIDSLQKRDEVIAFHEDSVLASLCCCLALQFELGDPKYDRLSAFFGVELGTGFVIENPWESEIVLQDAEFGIKFWRKDRGALTIRHRDLAYVIDGESLDSAGVLSSITIFPAKVHRHFSARGFRLVIVRDWILNSALCPDAAQRVDYLLNNQWEIESNIAAMQARLMNSNQLPFFGTHDIVDHLLNADICKFQACSSLYGDAFNLLSPLNTSQNIQRHYAPLKLSYLIGIVLDDLAQPAWYGSSRHEWLARRALADFGRVSHNGEEHSGPELPDSFHKVIQCLRDVSQTMDSLGFVYDIFIRDVFGVRR